MAYEHEAEEWVCAVAALTEMQHAATEYEVRSSAGICGGPEDADD